ncbi:hypothetical protein BKA64DRAFT_581059 [Cadophora sp. MPI-SDFR-AT-0126]|nr:hypothetical protein BKA64DRAFT_581059 [Leotiomycetes sp. MPI-SDFR-AT-0126]
MPYGALPNRNSTEVPWERESKGIDIGSNYRWPHSRRLFAAITAVVFSLAAVYVYLDRRNSTQNPESCGISAADAVSLGCHFDVISFAWLPEACYDGELSQQFLALRDWEWFLDSGGMHAVEMGSVLAGDYSQLYVTQEYHMYHCTYMWRKMHRAALRGAVLDGYIRSMMHTEHCELMLMDHKSAINETNTIIFTKFVECPVSNHGPSKAGWYRVIDGVMTSQSFEHH